jgi:hypothetical protein
MQSPELYYMLRMRAPCACLLFAHSIVQICRHPGCLELSGLLCAVLAIDSEPAHIIGLRHGHTHIDVSCHDRRYVQVNYKHGSRVVMCTSARPLNIVPMCVLGVLSSESLPVAGYEKRNAPMHATKHYSQLAEVEFKCAFTINRISFKRICGHLRGLACLTASICCVDNVQKTRHASQTNTSGGNHDSWNGSVEPVCPSQASCLYRPA